MWESAAFFCQPDIIIIIVIIIIGRHLHQLQQYNPSIISLKALCYITNTVKGHMAFFCSTLHTSTSIKFPSYLIYNYYLAITISN